ncbi:MAG: DUF2075 domain-containing protein [Mycoplasma sp.]|nr:DUF2075 domain-containing protein [Mycoplasma sp.]
MIIYDSTINEFLENVKDPYKISALINTNLINKFGIKVSESERKSWFLSLPKVAETIKKSKKDNRRILIEFNLPTSKKRVDFIILGKNKDGKPSAWIIELKQWSNITEVEWNNFRVGKYNDSHPSYQADDYKYRLEHEMGMHDLIDIKASAYLHNLNNENSPLLDKSKYNEILQKAWLYSIHDQKELSENINQHTIIKDGDKAFELFKDAKWNPTLSFKEHVENDFNNINLVGTQKLIFEKISRFIKSWNKEDKITFIISGDPGSGKTIIAFKLLNLLVSKLGMKLQMMLPGQEVRKAFKDMFASKILSTNISGANMRKGYDAAIIDEAHKAIGRDTGVINYKNNYKNLKFAIILIDNDQVINKKGINKETVEKIAIENGHKVRNYNIDENFRNSGERMLIDWIDSTFYKREIVSGAIHYNQKKYVNLNMQYKLHSYNDAKSFTDKYFEIRKKINSTRLTSLWSKSFYVGPADENGMPKATLFIGEKGFIWNPNEEWKNKLDNEDRSYFKTYNKEVKRNANDRKVFLTGNPHPNFIAYFNHIQGYEFENIFVYIPNIFTMDNNEIIFHRNRLAKEVKSSQTWSPNSKSISLGNNDPNKLNKLYFLNRLKVMLTRGTKSTHVFAEDKKLNDYIKNRII